MQLRGGFHTNDPRLDRIRQVDLRSLNYRVGTIWETDSHAPRSKTWALDLQLDQGNEGACVGFGFGHDLAAAPGLVTGVTNSYARERIYWEAQKIDPWAGGAYPGGSPFYEGTSVLAGAQILKREGFISEYRWALELEELVIAVGYAGPAVIGVDWYEGMLEPGPKGFIHATGDWMGGHCIIVVGVRINRNSNGSVNWLNSYFILQNSWGSDWGVNGRCKITFAHMMKLWPGGDFCLPLGRLARSV